MTTPDRQFTSYGRAARELWEQVPWWVYGCGLASVFVAMACLQALTKHPWTDEAWFASPSLNLITKGYMGMSVLETMGKMDHYTYWQPPLFYVTLAGWFKILGFSLFTQRLLSIVWGLVAIGSVYVITVRLTANRATALLAAAFLSIDCIFVRNSTVGRMDTMSAALGFAGYAAFMHFREHRLTLAVALSQSLIAASGLTHPNGFLEFLGLVFLTLFYDFKRLSVRHVLVAAVPYLIGTAGWGLYIAQAPDLFVEQIRSNGANRWRGVGNIVNNVRLELTMRYLPAWGFGPRDQGVRHILIVVPIVYVASLVALLLRPVISSRGNSRPILILVLIHCGFLSFFNDYNSTDYLSHVIPLLAIGAAIAVMSLLPKSRALITVPVVAMLVVFVAVQVGAQLYRIRTNDYAASYLPAAQWLRSNVASNQKIMGNAVLGYELGYTPRLIDDVRLGFFSGKRADVLVVEDEWRLQFSMFQKGNSSLYDHVTRTIREDFTKVYDRADYQIYVHK